MMASSKQAITHHLAALFFSCLKNQENQPIIYADATPPVLIHTHTNTYMYTCEMHLHMHTDMNNFNHTSFKDGVFFFLLTASRSVMSLQLSEASY